MASHSRRFIRYKSSITQGEKSHNTINVSKMISAIPLEKLAAIEKLIAAAIKE
jgi:hypothetical protein